MKTKFILSLGLLAGISATAEAVIVSGYGMEASTGTAGNCPSFCTGGAFASDSDGGEFSTSAVSSENTYGSASSSATYTGSTSTYLPILKVNTSSGVFKRASANAFGVQGYTYSGAATSITLDFNLHGSVGSNPSGYESNELRADIAVITSSSLEWFPHFSSLVFEFADPEAVVGNESVFLASDGLDQNVSSSITFDVIDGLDFYVIASMGANAQNGFADASSTLNLQFQNDAGLSAVATSAVPVPATVWLFGSGLVGLVSLARRKTKA